MSEEYTVDALAREDDDRLPRLLIVEDDLSQARLIELIFKHSDVAFDLQQAHTLAEARSRLEVENFDLVVTDLNLPDGLGVELLPADASNASYPVMLLTGQGDEIAAVQAIKAGAVDYIVKSDASIKALPNTVTKVIREWGNELLRRDMAEALKQKQQELEENHEKLQDLFKQVSLGKREWELTIDRVSDLIISTDDQGRIRRVNKAVIDLTGLNYRQLVGCELTEVLGQSLDVTKEQKNLELHHEPSGRFFLVTSYRLEEEEIETGMVITAHDYTEINELNYRLSESNQELALKTTELEEAYHDLKQTQEQVLRQEKMATVGQLAAGVAHEINNPMGFISSNLGTLRKYLARLSEYIETQDGVIMNCVPAQQLEALEAARKEKNIEMILSDLDDLVTESLEGAERVRKTVADLKGFSHQTEDVDVAANLNDLMEGVIPIVWNEIKYKATLNKNYGDIPDIYCRPRLLGQVVINLLINAVHSIEKQGEITIKTWQKNDTVCLSITDTGCGIPEEVMKRIFDPFFTTKEVGVGTGLGLSISYDIVKQHGGEMSVDSELNEGSKFTIALPISKQDRAGQNSSESALTSASVATMTAAESSH